MTAKAKIGIALGATALVAAAYGGYRYWRRDQKR